jgi:hypothetical protein
MVSSTDGVRSKPCAGWGRELLKIFWRFCDAVKGVFLRERDSAAAMLIALSDDVKKRVVQVMQERLAEASDMYSQAKFAHWNVKGDNFYQLHLVFDQVAKVVGDQVDPIAERITQLGGVANGTVRQAACVKDPRVSG